MLLLPTYYNYYSNKPITFLTIRQLDGYKRVFENETKFTFLNNLQNY